MAERVPIASLARYDVAVRLGMVKEGGCSMHVPRLGVLAALSLAMVSLGAVCVTSAGVITVESDEHRLARGGSVRVQADNADVRIVPSDSDVVRVRSQLRNAERIDYHVLTSSGDPADKVTVQVFMSNDAQSRAWVVMEIAVPSDARLDVQTVRGEIVVSGPLDGGGAFKTGNGEIIVRNVSGDYSLETESGPITASNLAGSLVAKTDVGAIRVDGTLLPTGPSSMTTRYGDVDLTLHEGSEVTLLGVTHNGRVEAGKGAGLTADGKRLSGSLGGGGARLDIAVQNGTIRVRQPS